MSTGDLGGMGKSDQQIGDITFSYNTTNAAGNALLATNGAMLDAKKYPLLAAKLGTKLEPAPPIKVAPLGAFSIAQSDDAEYCFYSVNNKLYRYKKNAKTSTVVLTSAQHSRGYCSCSASGQYVLALFSRSDGAYPASLYHSSDYGNSFTTVEFFNQRNGINYHGTFVSRNGQHMLVKLATNPHVSFAISHDFGATWSKHESNRDGLRIACLENLSALYMVWGGELYTSVDYGKTFNPSTMVLTKSITYFVIDPLNNDVMLASLGSLSELALSTDGGTTWRRIIDPRLFNTWRLQVYDSVITVIFLDDSRRYHLMVSHDFGATWHQSEILGGSSTVMDARMSEETETYFSFNGLYSSKIEEITRLPLGNLNSERIIADKVV